MSADNEKLRPTSIFDIARNVRPLRIGNRTVETLGDYQRTLVGRLQMLSDIEARAMLDGQPLTLDHVIEFRFTVLKKKRTAGRPKSIAYALAFKRWYIDKRYTQKEAFELYISEMNIKIVDEQDRSSRWESFRTAMKRNRKKLGDGNR